VFLKAKPSDNAIRDFLARQVQSQFSYAAVGASVVTAAPTGYVADHSRILLGYGALVWRHAVSAVNNWQMFNMKWVCVCCPEEPIVEGANVAVLIRHFGFWSLNAARIVYTISEDNDGSIKRYGFAYGTLLDHGESGEERFSVEWHARDDSVWYDLFAFSRPRAISARLGYPLARWLQSRFREDSKAAMVKAVILTSGRVL
jgi:uncharacterized protein (UPF0548 family)